jgi:hypothetical protein
MKLAITAALVVLTGCAGPEPSPRNPGRRGASLDNTPASAAGSMGEGSGLGTGTNSPSDTTASPAQPTP